MNDRLYKQPVPTEFENRLALRILVARMHLRIHIEILGNRAQRDIQLQVHYARRYLQAGDF